MTGVANSIESSIQPSIQPSTGISLGPELITNGGFDVDANWTKEPGWTIAGGVAIGAPGILSNLTQTISTFTARSYMVAFDVVSITAGSVQSVSANGDQGLARASVGSYAEILAWGNDNRIQMRKTSSFNGTIDNVSVREVL